MLYVGLTEDHRESATIFANVVGAQVISQKIASNYSKNPVASEISGWHAKVFLYVCLSFILVIMQPDFEDNFPSVKLGMI